VCNGEVSRYLAGILKSLGMDVDSVRNSKPPNERNFDSIEFIDRVTVEDVKLTIENIRKNSEILSDMENNSEILIVGGIHNLSDGTIKYL
jgi:carbonic anhydrase